MKIVQNKKVKIAYIALYVVAGLNLIFTVVNGIIARRWAAQYNAPLNTNANYFSVGLYVILGYLVMEGNIVGIKIALFFQYLGLALLLIGSCSLFILTGHPEAMEMLQEIKIGWLILFGFVQIIVLLKILNDAKRELTRMKYELDPGENAPQPVYLDEPRAIMDPNQDKKVFGDQYTLKHFYRELSELKHALIIYNNAKYHIGYSKKNYRWVFQPPQAETREQYVDQSALFQCMRFDGKPLNQVQDEVEIYFPLNDFED